MVLGSQVVDFLNTDLTNHMNGGLFIRDLDEIEDKYDAYHDYNVNASSVDPCGLVRRDSKDIYDVQTSSPGIVMIVEAEDVELETIDDFPRTLANALEHDTGFMVVSTSNHQNDDGMNQVSIILREGYVIVRIIPEQKYCGFDIHLWSSFDKHVEAKNSLLTAVRGKKSSSSSFRIIAGGMLGTASWREDDKLKGPQVEHICSIHEFSSHYIEGNTVSGIIDDGISEGNAIDNAIELSIAMLQDNEQVVAILCGGEADCLLANKKIESIDSVAKVVLLNCPTMTNFNEYDKEASLALASCEQHLAETLTEVLSDTLSLRSIDTIIIDQSADKMTGSIFLKVLQSRKKLARKLFKLQVKILSTCKNESEKWRMHIVKAFENTVLYERKHGFYTEVKFSGEESSFKLAITSSGDEHFVNILQNSMMYYDEAVTGLTPTILNIIGGKWEELEDPFSSRIFTPDDYDQSSSYEQWKSQIPLGHQVIFQMETRSILTDKLILDAVTHAVLHSSLPLFVNDEDFSTITKYSDAGDGCLIVFMWDGGSVLALWDGHKHVDVNLFVSGHENIDKLFAEFELKFLESIPDLKTTLRDEYPRGVGKVISYWEDMKEGMDPHWI